jgi:hypothetical protein
MAVKAVPGTAFEMVQAQFLFHLLVRVCHEISVAERQLVIAVRLNIYERLMIHLVLQL